jgi:hypothetical protein
LQEIWQDAVIAWQPAGGKNSHGRDNSRISTQKDSKAQSWKLGISQLKVMDITPGSSTIRPVGRSAFRNAVWYGGEGDENCENQRKSAQVSRTANSKEELLGKSVATHEVSARELITQLETSFHSSVEMRVSTTRNLTSQALNTQDRALPGVQLREAAP